MFLKREDLVKNLTKLGLTEGRAKAAVDAFFGALTTALREGRNVSIVGFGQWEWKRKKAGQARNPKTGARVALRDRRVLVFRPSGKLKARLNKKAN